jgi:hypothetical protein
MNTFEFFNENFGRHLVEQTGEPYQATARALSSNHQLAKGTSGRLASGWAIVKPSTATIQLKLAAEGLHYDDRTRYEAILEELDSWDGQPTLFMIFDKSPLSISNLFLTVDLRAVRVCTPSGVQTFDYTTAPSNAAPEFHRILFKMRNKNAR